MACEVSKCDFSNKLKTALNCPGDRLQEKEYFWTYFATWGETSN